MSLSAFDTHSTIIQQLSKSFNRLTHLLAVVNEPLLADHCQIWKAEKGARMLFNMILEGDKLLNQLDKPTLTKEEERKRWQFTNTNGHPALKKQQSEEQLREKLEEQPIEYFSQINISMVKDEEDNALKQNKGMNNCLIKMDPPQNYFSSQYKNRKQYLRGPYKSYPRQLKQKMVALYKNDCLPISKISAQFGVPIKNIKRWAQNGIDRKEGAGRKRLDPKMEENLFSQIKQKFPLYSQIQYDQLRRLALNLSNIEDFKASKGWIISFIQRYKLGDIYKII